MKKQKELKENLKKTWRKRVLFESPLGPLGRRVAASLQLVRLERRVPSDPPCQTRKSERRSFPLDRRPCWACAERVARLSSNGSVANDAQSSALIFFLSAFSVYSKKPILALRIFIGKASKGNLERKRFVLRISKSAGESRQTLPSSSHEALPMTSWSFKAPVPASFQGCLNLVFLMSWIFCHNTNHFRWKATSDSALHTSPKPKNLRHVLVFYYVLHNAIGKMRIAVQKETVFAKSSANEGNSNNFSRLGLLLPCWCG